jgi:transcriptional regulator with XRE-family HTH domain
MATPTLVYETRLRLGWKQATLATYLGVSRSLLSMAEAGERELPTAAYLRLLHLINLMPPPLEEPIAPVFNPAEKEELAIRLAKEMKRKKWEAIRLQQKADRLKERLHRLLLQRGLNEKAMNAPHFMALESREKNFWQQQEGMGQVRMVPLYIEWLKTTQALELHAMELQALEVHIKKVMNI